MSANQTPVFLKYRRSVIVEAPATTVASYTLVTFGPDGGQLLGLAVRNSHTAAVQIDFKQNNGSDVVLASLSIPAYAGSVNGGVNVPLFDALAALGLTMDQLVERHLPQSPNAVVKVSVPSHPTTLQFLASYGDY